MVGSRKLGILELVFGAMFCCGVACYADLTVNEHVSREADRLGVDSGVLGKYKTIPFRYTGGQFEDELVTVSYTHLTLPTNREV